MDESLRTLLFNVLVPLAVSLFGIAIVRLQLRNDREKLKVEADKASVDAQNIINDEFVKIRTEFDAAQKERREDSIRWAEERGGLKQQIEHLQKQLNQERELRERSGTENAEKIGKLTSDLEQMRQQYQQLSDRLTEVQKERDTTSQELQIKIGELEVLKVEFTKRLSEIGVLQQQLQEQDAEIKRLKLELDGRPEPIAPNGTKETVIEGEPHA